MQKILNKTIAIIIIAMLVGINFVPSVSYAANEIKQDSKTSESNVEFNAMINNGYSSTMDITEKGNLMLNIKVSESGYLKDAKITLKDNNYTMSDATNENIKEINGNEITLNEIKAGQVANISIPVHFDKKDQIELNDLNKDSKVTLNAIYVNEKGKERKIEKSLTLHVEWSAEDATEVVKQTLVRFIKYDDHKTMLSFKVEEGIENNKIPATEKTTTIKVAKLNNVEPEKVIVTGEGIEYKYENGEIVIHKNNTASGKVNWNSQDNYMITYIYDPQESENNYYTSEISAVATVKGKEIKGESVEKFDISKQIGSFVQSEINGTNEINKGYMYTNTDNDSSKLDTQYSVEYKLNIGYSSIIDKIVIKEDGYKFGDANADNSIVNKKISINKDNLVQLLGEDGIVKILAENGKELGTLNKDKTEIDINESKISLETSKPVSEGDLKVIVTKAIKGKQSYSRAEIKNLKILDNILKVYAYKDEKEISNQTINKEINLTEPTSNASIDISSKNLSTVVNNEDVVITATLETNNMEDALYRNPELKITLPQEVKDISLKDAKLIYEDELKPVTFTTNGNEIYLKLNGTQTVYSSQSTSEGTVLRIVADLGLDNLAPTSEGKVTLSYTNEATAESKQVEKEVNVVAPTGFVTTNSVEVNGTKVTSQEGEEKTQKVQVKTSQKEMTLSGTIVNNLGNDSTGVTIVGNIPSKDANDVNGNSLNSNLDTQLSSAIKLNGIDADVYYSENVNEKIDGTSWKTIYTQNARSYKIVAKNIVKNKSRFSYSYNVILPENLEYGQTSKSTYALYYNNDAQEGTKQNVIIAKSVGVTTGEIPDVKAEMNLTNLNSGAKITDGANVQEGQYIQYDINVKNTGKENATNVNVTTTLPEGLAFIQTATNMSSVETYKIDTQTKSKTEKIATIKAGESTTISYKVAVTKILSSSEQNAQLNVTTKITADKIEEAVYGQTVNVVKGYLVASLTSDKTNKTLKAGDTVTYYMNIKNVNFDVKNNIQATIVFPNEIKVTSVANNEGTTYTYNEKTNTLVYTNSKLAAGATDGLLINAKVNEFNKDVEVQAKSKIKCDEMEDLTLADVKHNLVINNILVSQSSNISESSMNDNDEIEYYIDVKNNKNENVTVSVSDTLPSELRIKGYRIKDINGEKKVDAASRTILTSMTIKAGETARLTVVAVPYKLEKGKTETIENKAVVTLDDSKFETNVVSHKIIGTSKGSAGDNSSNNENNSNNNGNGQTRDDEETKDGTYKISGTAWFDKNNNGKKEQEETKLQGITVKLYNKDTGSIAKDVDGKELSKVTDNEGKYTFTNVQPGNYIVVAEYDENTYDITSYHVEGLVDAENSDFVLAKIVDKQVAATDTIAVTNANTYNIDLGLISKKKFDLKLSKTITKITVANPKTKTRAYDYDHKTIAKVELSTSYTDYATVLVEYTIQVTNEGDIPGYAKEIVDYIPSGMTFNSELNKEWYLGKDGNAYSTTLANTIINPGETKEIKFVLSKKMTNDNMGTFRNTAEIKTSYNEYGIEDIDSKAGNKQDGEDDMSSADAVIAMSTGKEAVSYAGIAIGVLALIAFAVYEIKKHVISKMYNIL